MEPAEPASLLFQAFGFDREKLKSDQEIRVTIQEGMIRAVSQKVLSTNEFYQKEESTKILRLVKELLGGKTLEQEGSLVKVAQQIHARILLKMCPNPDAQPSKSSVENAIRELSQLIDSMASTRRASRHSAPPRLNSFNSLYKSILNPFVPLVEKKGTRHSGNFQKMTPQMMLLRERDEEMTKNWPQAIESFSQYLKLREKKSRVSGKIKARKFELSKTLSSKDKYRGYNPSDPNNKRTEVSFRTELDSIKNEDKTYKKLEVDKLKEAEKCDESLTNFIATIFNSELNPIDSKKQLEFLEWLAIKNELAQEPFCKSLIMLMSDDQMDPLLKEALDQELNAANTLNELFRSNAFSQILIGCFFARVVHSTIQPTVSNYLPTLETEPLASTQENLQPLVNALLDKINSSFDDWQLSPRSRELLSLVNKKIIEKWQDSAEGTLSIATALFLHGVTPLIVNYALQSPSQHRLIKFCTHLQTEVNKKAERIKAMALRLGALIDPRS